MMDHITEAKKPTRGKPISATLFEPSRLAVRQMMAAIPAWAEDRFIFKTLLQPGPPDEVLADVAAKLAPDLIVVGVKRRRLKRFFIGSTTEYILRRAGCTVLTVPLVK